MTKLLLKSRTLAAGTQTHHSTVDFEWITDEADHIIAKTVRVTYKNTLTHDPLKFRMNPYEAYVFHSGDWKYVDVAYAREIYNALIAGRWVFDWGASVRTTPEEVIRFNSRAETPTGAPNNPNPSKTKTP